MERHVKCDVGMEQLRTFVLCMSRVVWCPDGWKDTSLLQTIRRSHPSCTVTGLIGSRLMAIQGSSSTSELPFTQISSQSALQAKSGSSSAKPSLRWNELEDQQPCECIYIYKIDTVRFCSRLRSWSCTRRCHLFFPGLRQGFATLPTEFCDLPTTCTRRQKKSHIYIINCFFYILYSFEHIL